MSDVEFTLTVHSSDGVMARTSDGASATDVVDIDHLRRESLNTFLDWLHRGMLDEPRDIEVLGLLLYRALFNGAVGKLFDSCLAPRIHDGRPHVGNERLRIRLDFGDDDDLALLPWEFLSVPTDIEYPLATRSEVTLARLVSSSSARPQLRAPANPPLRVLIVIANTGGSPDVIDRQIKEIEGRSLGAIDTTLLDHPSLHTLINALSQTSPNMLHVIGTGREQGRRAQIGLPGRDDESLEWIDEKDFADALQTAGNSPSIVLLQLAEPVPDDRFDWRRLAQRLVQSGVQAVVTLQLPMAGSSLITFTRTLYRELARGRVVDDAVQAGRARVSIDGDPHGRAPVLYLGSAAPLIIATEPTPTSASPR